MDYFLGWRLIWIFIALLVLAIYLFLRRVSRIINILNIDIWEYDKTSDKDGYVQRKYQELCQLYTTRVRRYIKKEAVERELQVEDLLQTADANGFGWMVQENSLFVWAWSDDPQPEESPTRYQLTDPSPEILELWHDLRAVQLFAEMHGVEDGLLD